MDINRKKIITYQKAGLPAVARSKAEAGVTLIELIVVMAIFAIVSAVLLFNYTDFDTNISIRNLSQEVALSVRKAQTYATSVHGVNTTIGGRAYPAYGIAFSMEPSNGTLFAPNPKQFIIFADIIPGGQQYPNKRYDGNGTCGAVAEGAECVESIAITTPDSLVSMEADLVGVLDISTGGTMMVTFRRPSPDAIICYIPHGETDCTSSLSSYVKLTFKSYKGLTRTVSVWNTGQIDVK